MSTHTAMSPPLSACQKKRLVLAYHGPYAASQT
jgi:hypothetical protein